MIGVCATTRLRLLKTRHLILTGAKNKFNVLLLMNNINSLKNIFSTTDTFLKHFLCALSVNVTLII